MEVSVSDYKRLNDDALVEIEQVLRRRGTSAGRRGDSLRCELSFGGAPYGVAYFVSAPFLFALDQQPVAEQGLDAYELELQRSKRRDFENDFRQFQEELCSDDVGAQSRKDLYLFVVGTASFLQHELPSPRACRAEYIVRAQGYRHARTNGRFADQPLRTQSGGA
jgi:hypothetical protein